MTEKESILSKLRRPDFALPFDSDKSDINIYRWDDNNKYNIILHIMFREDVFLEACWIDYPYNLLCYVYRCIDYNEFIHGYLNEQFITVRGLQPLDYLEITRHLVASGDIKS